MELPCLDCSKMLSVVLIEPENPGNLGAVARVMKNFGQKKLILITPKTKINEETRCRAKHAQDILNNAKVVDATYLDKMDVLVGTTAKTGTDYNIPRSYITPDILAKKINLKQKVGLIIGREGTGLSNAEIRKCDVIVTIPTSSKYPTLNISHALGIILYEISKHGKKSRLVPASKKDMDVMQDYIHGTLDNMQFTTPDKKKTQKIVWKRVLGKAMLSKREAYALIGFFKKLKPKK